jgi:hypothetical protein
MSWKRANCAGTAPWRISPATRRRSAGCWGCERDSPDFLRIGSGFVIAAPLPLALGIALDLYVAIAKAAEAPTAAAVAACLAMIVLLSLWYAYPALRRRWQRST